MPISSAALDAARSSEGNISTLYLSVLAAPTIWSARVNDGGIGYGETAIVFDGGSGLDFSLVRAVQEVWVGTAAGDDDIGRIRIRGISSGDSGVTGTVSVAPNDLPWVDDAYLTFKFDFPLKPRYAYVDPNTEIFYKDYDITYSDQNEQPPPVLVAGPHRAGFIDDAAGYWEVAVDLSDSCAVADGASISSYAMTVLALPAGSYTQSFDTGTGLGYVRFTDPGTYWIEYEVTDSNGKSQTGWRWYEAHDDDPNSAYYPLVDFAVTLSANRGDGGGGRQCGINAGDDFDADELPGRALAIVWAETTYGGTQQTLSRLPDGAPNWFTGYVVSDVSRWDLATGVAEADFSLVTAEGWLGQFYGFSMSLRAVPSPDAWYLYSSWLTTGRGIHHLWRWHSTLFEVCDVLGLREGDDLRLSGFIPEGDLYSIAAEYASDERLLIVADAGGRIHLAPDIQLLTDAERTALADAMAIETADRSGPITFDERAVNVAPFTTASGVYFAGTFNGGDATDPDYEEYCSQAPGIPDETGPRPEALTGQVVRSQAHTNEIAGRLFGKVNLETKEVRITFHGNYVPILEPALEEWYTISLNATEHPRGVSWSKNLILREVQAEIDVEQGYSFAHAVFEPEAEGVRGVTTECPGLPELGGTPEPIAEDDGLPGGLYTAASVNYLGMRGTSWTQLLAKDVEDMVLDPYWSVRTGSDLSGDAILWICGSGFIERTVDGGTTWGDVTPGTDPPNDAGDSPAPTAGDLTYVMLDASFVNQGAFAGIARWYNGSNWRTWLFYTDDDGATYSWASIVGEAGSIPSGDPVTQGTVLTYAANDNPQPTKTYSIYKHDANTLYGTSFKKFSASEFRLRVTKIDRSGTTLTVDTYDEQDVGGETDTERLYPQIAKFDSTYLTVVDEEIYWSLTTLDPTISNNVKKNVETVEHLHTFDIGDDYVGAVWGDGSNTIRAATFINSSAGPTAQTVTTGNYILGAVQLGHQSSKVLLLLDDNTVAVFDFDTMTMGTPSGDIDAGNTIWSGGGAYIGNDQVALFFKRSTDYVLRRIITVSGDSVTDIGTLSGSVLNVNAYQVAYDGDGTLILVTNSTSTAATYRVTVYEVGAGTVAYSHYTLFTYSSGSDDEMLSWDKNDNVQNIGLLLTSMDTGVFAMADPDHITTIGPSGSDADLQARILTVPQTASGSGSYDAYGLGVELSKVSEGYLWATVLVDGRLQLQKYAMPALTVADEYDLGAATLSEAQAQTYAAYPVADPSNEETCYVFGRMQDPQSLGDPVHIIKTADAGTSFSLIEDGWSTDLCGALLVAVDGVLTAVRNASYGKLYRGDDSGLDLKCTLTFPAGSAPHGMDIDPYTGNVYVGADTGQAIMVLRVAPPYNVSEIANITYDHDTAAGIESVVKL